LTLSRPPAGESRRHSAFIVLDVSDIREARRFSLSGAVQNDNDQKDDKKCLMYMRVMENIQLAALKYTPENYMGILSCVLGGRPRESSGGI
jgi:hypothetical protein